MCNNCMGKCGMGSGCVVSVVMKVLVIVGGLNWGLVGLGMLVNSMSSWNLVEMLLGGMPAIEAIVYLLVGLAALGSIFGCRCKKCMETCATCTVDKNMDSKKM